MGKIADISECLLVLGLAGTVSETERAIVQLCLTAAEGAIRRHLRYDPAQVTRTEFYPQLDPTAQGRAGIWEVNDVAAYERTLSVEAADHLQLQHVPIRSITDLRVDYDGRNGTRSGSFGTSTQWTEGVDFFPNYDGIDSDGAKICRDGMIRSEGRWPNVPGSVKITYIAGYTAAELRGQDSLIDASPIHEAVIDETTRRLHKHMSRAKHLLSGFSGAKTSENLGDYSYSADGGTLTNMISGAFDLLPETELKLADFVNLGWSLGGG